MKLNETPVTAIRAGDRIDLHTEQDGFYTVLRVRTLASNLLAFPSPSEDDESIEFAVVRRPHPMPNGALMHFAPKYIYRSESETLTKLEETEL